MTITFSQPTHPLFPAHFAGLVPVSSPPASRSQRLAALGQCLMQRLDTPLFVCDADGALLEANATATCRIARRDGLWLDAGGRLALRQGGRWVPLSRWHAQVAVAGELALPLEADGTPPQQLVLRTMSAGDDAHAGCWLLATIEALPLAQGDALRRRFKFTRTQVRLAELLCAGMRPVHAAQTLGVKISTIRTHVGQMYEKTGTHSQAQLMALLSAA